MQLGGDKWDGRGLDAETQNGSVRMAIPSAYAAQLETAERGWGVSNGSIAIRLPDRFERMEIHITDPPH